MISKFSVKKPYTVLVGVVLVIVLGVVALMKTNTDLLPNMNLPYAIIITTYVGASPEEVEKTVTAPIEAQMATTSNIKNVTSQSQNSLSMVILEYEQTANMDSTIIEIQQKIDQISSTFPDSVASPFILELDPTMLPIVVASADMEGMNQLEVSDYVNDNIVPNIESVDGVASVTTIGGCTESISVTIDEEKLDKLNEKIVKKIDEKFEDPRKELADAREELEKGQNTLESKKNDVAKEIADGSNEIINGKITVSVTESELKSTLETLKKTKEDLEKGLDGLKQAKSGADKLEQGIAGLDAAAAAAQAMIGQDIPGTNGTMQFTEETAYAAVLGQAGLADLEGNPITTKAGLDAFKGVLQAQLADIDSKMAEMGSKFSDAGVTLNSHSDLPAAIGKITESLAKVNSGISDIYVGLNKLDETKGELNDAYIELQEGEIKGILEMAKAQSELASGLAQITQGEDQLEAAYDAAVEQADMTKILTVSMVSNLITAQNFEMPAGYIQEGDTQYLIRVGDEVKSEEELNNLILVDLGMEGIEPIYLKDVANVVRTDDSADSYARINGNPAIMLSIEKQTGFSTGDVADRVLERFDELESTNEGLHMSVLMNQGVYIDLIVESVLQNMLIGAVLAVIILIIFLKDFKSTFIIGCSIPLSVIFAIVLMYFTGISLNIISLSGLALGIGMLVDNSIVVIENIYRLRKEGKTIRMASVMGADQVAGSIIASTITTVCVFAPIIFTTGITRQLFADLALTITYTLAASLIVALTFVPMMASFMIKDGEEKQTKLFDKIRDAYADFMMTVLSFKPLVFAIVVILLAVSIFAGLSRGFTFMDMDMEADQISLTLAAKEDEYLTEEELRGCCDELTEILETVDGIETIGIMTGGNSLLSALGSSGDSATVYIILDPDTKRKSSEISDEIADKTKDMICDVTSSGSGLDFSAYFGSGIGVMIKGRDMDTLRKTAVEIADILEDTPGCIDVDPGLGETTTSYTIHVDKEKAMKYKMTVAQIFQLVYGQMASTSSSASIATDLKDYDVFIKNSDQAEVKLDDLRKLTFDYTDSDGNTQTIRLLDVASVEIGESLDTISRDSQSRYITVTAGIADGYNVTKVSSAVNKKLEKYNMPDGYTYKMTGEDETIMDAMKQLVLMLILAVIFIYLVMVAQFQSLLSPFIIMFTIPLAFTGGFLALFFAGYELSVIGMIGFIMLAGIIVNNGIVMVDYINQLRREGMLKREAICEACKSRLRPILMTALTTIISMIPMALGMGDGSEMMQPMAIVMIGGLVYGTLLTLFVVPCVYDIFNKEKSMVDEEFGDKVSYDDLDDGNKVVTEG